MINVALIPARGGSVGVPRKNILELAGRPLISWTIDAAAASGMFDDIVVSTDSSEIASIATDYGATVPFIRPQELATATSGSAQVLLHALEFLGMPDTFAFLQPTSPFRSAKHLKEANDVWTSVSAPALASVSAQKPIEWQYKVDESGVMIPYSATTAVPHQRQAATHLVAPNGAIYFGRSRVFKKQESFLPAGTMSYLMDPIDSLDIDTPEDFWLAQLLAKDWQGSKRSNNF